MFLRYCLKLKLPFQKNLIHDLESLLYQLFGAAQGWWGKMSPLSKICHTYAKTKQHGTVIPCLKKIQKTYESNDKPFEF